MKKFLIATAAVAAFAGAALADGHVIRMGTEGAYEPWNYLDENGEVAGFERVLGDELCARAGLSCVWVTNEWDSIIPNLVAGNYDTIIAGMSITAERDEIIDFTNEYYPNDASLFASANGEIGTVVAAQTNTIQAGHIAATAGLTLLEFATPDETVAAVANGEADSMLADGSYVMEMIAGGADMQVAGEVRIGGGVGMGIRETDGDLKAAFNGAIESMKADGSLNALLAEWFPDLDFAGY